jgi:hypothetical protein
MSLFARAAAFARSPQGRRALKKASAYARSPEGKKQLQRVVETAKARRAGKPGAAPKKRARW